MKKLMFFIIMCSYMCFGQEVSLTWSENIKTPGNLWVLGQRNGYYYTAYRDNDEPVKVRKYDNTMKLVDEKEVATNIDNKYLTYWGAFLIHNKIHHYFKREDSKGKRTYLLTCTTDLDLNRINDLKVIDEVSEKDRIYSFGTRSLSPDRKKIVIYHEALSNDDSPSTFVYKVYNTETGELENEGSAPSPAKIKHCKTNNILIDDAGTVLFLSEIEREDDVKDDNIYRYLFKLTAIDKNKKTTEFDFDFPGSAVKYIYITAWGNGEFTGIGLLSKLKKDHQLTTEDQLFSVKIDLATNKVLDSNVSNLEGLYPDLKDENNSAAYRIRCIYKKSDGGYSIVAEQYEKKEITGEKYDSFSKRYVSDYSIKYFFLDIACIQTDAKGNVSSVTRIPKYQENFANPSIICTFKDDKTYCFYEDLTKNLTAEDDRTVDRRTRSLFGSRSKNSIFMISINGDGTFKKEILYDQRENKINTTMLNSMNTMDGEILFFSKNRLGLLEIK